MVENYYQVLGIEESAQEEEIRSAYKALLSIHNTEYSYLNDSARESHLKLLNDAFNTLVDAKRRLDYNRMLANEMKIEIAEQEADLDQKDWDINQLGGEFLPQRYDFLNWSLIKTLILFCAIIGVIIYFFVH
ncbi:MAG: DnaJ domain-containing protein [Candidatus Caenarcaniphilales bacterium]|nr:DnaJ domain-containing protein [Candidatus Caenarcaniphilales bacterium]